MKKLVLAGLAAGAMTASAMAADLPSRKAPIMVPPPPPVFTWSGFYAGVNAGLIWPNSQNVAVTSGVLSAIPATLNIFPNPTAAAAATASSGIINTGTNVGFAGGAQIGYNWQFPTMPVVIGVEADIDGIARKTRTSSIVGVADALTSVGFAGNNVSSIVSVSKNLSYLGTVRARLGYAFAPTFLVYGTGGLAYANVKSGLGVINFLNGANLGLCCGNPIGFSSVSTSSTKLGFTLGGGIEWMFLPNWSFKAEYLYYNLGTRSIATLTSPIATVGAGFPVGSAVYTLATGTRIRYDGNIVRAGVNYHFNWGAPLAPVVARY